MSYALSTLAAGLPFGYSICYAAKIEGLPYIWIEKSVGTAPTGYTLDASLVVDDSAMVGSEVDRESGVGRGFDLTLRLDDTANVRTLVAAPLYRAALTADVDHADNTITVDTTSGGWPASGSIYIGRECITYTGTTATSFTGCTRGTYGRAYDYDSGSPSSQWVTSSPVFHRGREVRLYAVLVDPWGHGVGTDVLQSAAMLWMGHITDPPIPESDGLWTIGVRALDRRLTDPICPGLTGSARWSLDADPLIEMSAALAALRLRMTISWTASGSATERHECQPFLEWDDLTCDSTMVTCDSTEITCDATLGGSPWYRLSQLRAQIKAAFDTVLAADSALGTPTLEWVDELKVDDAGQVRKRWQALVRVDFSGTLVDPTPVIAQALVEIVSGSGAYGAGPFAIMLDPGTGLGVGVNTGWGSGADPANSLLPTTLFALADVRCGTLSVRVDDGAVDDVPESGWIIIGGEGGSRDLYRYTAHITDPDDPGCVILRLDPEASPALSGVAAALVVGGDVEDVAVEFCQRYTGTPAAAMLTAIESGGRAVNGAYDTADQGLDLDAVDESSFTSELGSSFFPLLSTDVVVTDDASFADLWGGLLALSRHAVVARPDADASDVELACVFVGQSDTGPYSDTISDSDLASVGGSQPVRAARQWETPTSVSVSTSEFGSDAEAKIIVSDLDRQRAEGVRRWELEVPGYTRADLEPPVQSWAQSLLALGHTAQAIEVDVAPWIEAQIGDCVYLSITHWAVYSRSTGTRGYTGPGRVVGRKLDLASQLVTLTLLVDGAVATCRLCPSAPITSWTGIASAPATIRVALSYLPIMSQVTASATAQVYAYLPSEDTAGTYAYVISAAAENGGACELTVQSQIGAFTITTDWHLSWAESASDNAQQALYLHTDTNASWG